MRKFRSKYFSYLTSEILAWRGFRKGRSAKIWFSKNLDIKILKTNGLGQPDLDAPNGHGLDYHCAREGVGARLDVTRILWKKSPPGYAGRGPDASLPLTRMQGSFGSAQDDSLRELLFS